MKWFKNNLANIISSFRVVFIPYLIYAALVNLRQEFVWATAFLYFTDVVDGNIARALKTTSKLGQEIDTYADYPFYAAVLATSYYIMRVDFFVYTFLFLNPIILCLLPKFIGIYYLKRVPALHLRIWQLSAFPLMVWIFISILSSFNLALLIFINFVGLWGCIEESLVYFIQKDKTNENLKSVFELRKKLSGRD